MGGAGLSGEVFTSLVQKVTFNRRRERERDGPEDFCRKNIPCPL